MEREAGYLEDSEIEVLQRDTNYQLKITVTEPIGENFSDEGVVSRSEDTQVFKFKTTEERYTGRLQNPVKVREYEASNNWEEDYYLLTNERIEQAQKDYKDWEHITLRMIVSEYPDYLEAEYPEDFGDVDISCFTHDNPNVGESIQKIEHRFHSEITRMRKELNERFIKEELGERVSEEELQYLLKYIQFLKIVV